MSNYVKTVNFAVKDSLLHGDPAKVVRGSEIDTEFNNIATAIATKTDNAAALITGGSINGVTIGNVSPGAGTFTTLNATSLTTTTLTTTGALTGRNIVLNLDSASFPAFDVTDTNAAGCRWLFGPGAGTGNRGDFNLYDATTSNLVAYFPKNSTGGVGAPNMLIGVNGDAKQHSLRIYGHSAGNKAPVLSLFRSGANEYMV